MKGSSSKTILSRLLSVFYLAAICFLCFSSSGSLPSVKMNFLGLDADKVAHFLMFAPYPILAYLSFDHPAGRPWKSVLFIFLSLVVGCVIAASTEFVQKFIPTRAMDINDFYADAVALVSVSLFVLCIDLIKRQR